MTEPCNPVTQTYRGGVTNPAPHHTTPHHTTKNRDLGSSDSVRRPPPGTDLIAAAATTLLMLRPDWRWDHTYEALRDDPRAWRTVVAAALACALDPQSHPRLIAYQQPARFAADTAPTPTPPPLAEVLRRQRQLTEEDR